MHGVRGASKQPGEVRRSQNWIGGSRPGNAAYVPPPPHTLPDLLGDLEKYLHAERRACRRSCEPASRTCSSRPSIPTSTATAAIGRLLIALLLEHWGAAASAAALPQPLLQAASRRILPPAKRSAKAMEGWTTSSSTACDHRRRGRRLGRELFAVVTADRAGCSPRTRHRSRPHGCSSSCRAIRSSRWRRRCG